MVASGATPAEGLIPLVSPKDKIEITSVVERSLDGYKRDQSKD